ncbi:protein translocase subunit SecF [Paramaledivibacter caminithermalis]|jgi:preprotein translocase SecF subunit|uniref:Protein-export membrane protein SecF n=1 Tax=Paramaledivibacter caminithermalis (strain DSM 15212 / CIP 107654 / DViRD3) TaxID=1121301 RepID=A0A1M6JX01_PARC5|nr:protein translocase subunit SecF [Paramaledivibacter caminithermalis]SHJ51178.1 protein translocase subunit secF [Paramaledivibacter caminithermalis DSM 15212]
MKIAQNYKIWFSISSVVMILGLVMAIVSGINFGIDFTGGTLMQFNIGQDFTVDEIKEITDKFELKADILHAGVDKKEVIIKTKKDLPNQKRIEIFNAFKQKYNLEDSDFRQAQQFGPAMGDEIRNKALISILLASVGMLLYITYRFQFRFGAAAIVALVHDTLIVLSLYAILKIPVNSPFIAAILTIVGYSINDTIVVFDRLRENLKYRKRETYFEIADTSIKQTLTRSINTSVTTLLVIGSLYIFGVESIKEFALPLLAGVLTGTYSSIFIASPVWALSKSMAKR